MLEQGHGGGKFCCTGCEVIYWMPIDNFVDDTWAYNYEKHGHFIVRSAYKTLVSRRLQDGRASSSGDTVNKCWKKLWKMAVPPKVRNFWWSVIYNFIPCRAVLRDRHVERITLCEACGEEETTTHALVDLGKDLLGGTKEALLG